MGLNDQFDSFRWWMGRLITLARIHTFAVLSLATGVYFFGFSQIARELWEDVLAPVRLGALVTTVSAALLWLWALAWASRHAQGVFASEVARQHQVEWPSTKDPKQRERLLGLVAGIPAAMVLLAAAALLFGAVTSEISERDKLTPLVKFGSFAACATGLVGHWAWLAEPASDRARRRRSWVVLQLVFAVLLAWLLGINQGGPSLAWEKGGSWLIPTFGATAVAILVSSWFWLRPQPSVRQYLVHAALRLLLGIGIVLWWWGLKPLSCHLGQLENVAAGIGPLPPQGCSLGVNYRAELGYLALVAFLVPIATIVLEWLYLRVRALTAAPTVPITKVIDYIAARHAWISAARAVAPVLVGAFAFALWPVAVGSGLGALAVALLALAAWTVFCVVVFIATPIRLGFGAMPLLLPLWLLVVSPWTDNHDIDGVHAAPAAARAVLEPKGRIRQRIDLDFDEWLRSPARSPSSTTPIALVAASGGGIRAAYWTATVLAQLDDFTCGEFGRQVFAISTVSGGSIGAAVYVAARQHVDAVRPYPAGTCQYRTRPAQADDEPGPVEEVVQRTFNEDLLAPLLGSLLFPDALQRFVPAALQWGDRARAIELAMEQGWTRATGGSKTLARPLLGLYEQDHNRTLPLLVFSSTNVADGRRVIASPVLLADSLAYDLFAQDLVTHGMRISTAAHNSARFPAVSPPGSVRDVAGRAVLRIVDGGYFENSAAATATSIYRTLQRRLVHERRPLALLLIENDPGLEEPSVPCSLEAEQLVLRTFGQSQDLLQLLSRSAAPSPTASPQVSDMALELTAIAGALLNARTARAPWHQRELAELVCADPQNLMRGLFYREGFEEHPKAMPDPALSWALSASTRKRMSERSRGLVQQALTGRLAAW